MVSTPLDAARRRRRAGTQGNGVTRRESRMQDLHQQSLPVFVHPDEEDISRQAIMRLTGFLRAELARLPEWHPLHHEYRQQLQALGRRVEPGPRPLA